MFTERDHSQISSMGISPETIEKQLSNFRAGFPFLALNRPATPGDGITCVDETAVKKYQDFYEERAPLHRILKFVPASGAASRMFKHLFEFMDNLEITRADDAKSSNMVYEVLDAIGRFAFYEDLKEIIGRNGDDIQKMLLNKEYCRVIDFLLSDKGLNYAALPKAFLKFHRYADGSRMAIEEHLVEAAHYARAADGTTQLHFTLSPDHINRFHFEMGRVLSKYERMFGLRYDVSYSIQKPSTDTIAADLENLPFRDREGKLLFRPGGHGALIENLNDLEADIVFIKNIDNVVPDSLREETYLFKKVIGGFLLSLVEQINKYLKLLEKENTDDARLGEIQEFISVALQSALPANTVEMSAAEKKAYLFSFLNRPVRVCGMVKNEGEPGGGPFWARNSRGEISLQIAESSQVNLTEPNQKEIFARATHFNPVDLVCSIRDYKGIKFDLHRFIDPSTGFISVKSYDGRSLKAQELPGLWNGAMADWITVFVEVPAITFNPVKTINDLLRKEHQC